MTLEEKAETFARYLVANPSFFERLVETYDMDVAMKEFLVRGISEVFISGAYSTTQDDSEFLEMKKDLENES